MSNVLLVSVPLVPVVPLVAVVSAAADAADVRRIWLEWWKINPVFPTSEIGDGNYLGFAEKI